PIDGRRHRRIEGRAGTRRPPDTGKVRPLIATTPGPFRPPPPTVERSLSSMHDPSQPDEPSPPTAPSAPPLTPPARRGRTRAIVLGVTVPTLVVALAVAAVLLVPRLIDGQPAAAPTSPTPTAIAVPEAGSCYAVRALSVLLRNGAEQET